MAETFRIEIPVQVQDKTDPGVSRATAKMNGFDKANQKTQERLEKMNRTRFQIVLDALDRASGIVGKVSTSVRSFAGKTFSFTMKVLDVATAPLRGIWNMVTSIQGAILGATGAFAGIYKPMQIAGDYEQTQIAFETMLKSADKAKTFLQEATDFANKTPFEFPELINSSKLLLAFGFEADNVLNLMSVIGDTASGLGAGAEGIDRITRALGQMQAKGRAQAEELLQLQELGVPANQILQEELGLTASQVGNIGNESIEAAKVIDALLRGMDKRFGGMMQNQSRTAKGMISTLADTLKNGLLRPWGQGLWEGIKPGLSKLTTWIEENSETVTSWGEAWKEAGANISKWVMAKVEALQSSIRKMTNSQEWKNAQTFGDKIRIAWNTIIAQPFSEWWNSTGKQFFIDKATSIGQGIGSGIRVGLLALLGIDVSESLKEGQSVGAGFLSGFKKGFDTEQITEALKEWANNNKEIVAGLGVILGWKLITGIAGQINTLSTLFKGRGKGSADTLANALPSAYATTTMTVTASVVNVYGGVVNNAGEAARTAVNLLTSAGGAAAGTAAVTAGAAAGRALLTGGTQLALPAAAGAASGLGSGYVITAPTAAAGTDIVLGTTGSMLTAGLAKAGIALGSTASTVGGAAAAGAAGSAGIIGGILGLGSAAIDLFKGIGKSKEGDTKGAKDQYVTAGTKTGMVAAGAGAGALIGSVVPGVGTAIGALVGAGVGGVGALFGGNKAGKAISDATDEDGALTKLWETVKKGSADAGSWIQDKWSGFSDWFDNSVWTPTKDIGISAINIAAGAWSGIRDFISDKWADFSGWFDETVWTPVKGAAQVAGQWVGDRWNEARTWVGDRWADFSGWFDQTIWTPVKTGAQAAGNWISEKWSEAKTVVSEAWGTVSGWFDETIWEPVKGAAKTAGDWLGDQFTAAKDAISNVWEGVPGWFENNVWGPIKSGATSAWNWVGDKLNGIGDWVGDKWTSFSNWLGGLGQKGSKETGLTTSKGKSSVLEHAYGGIFTQPHMGLVAEAGAESIIPLSPSRRTRGIDLWRETGELLGVRPYANGGIIGRIEADSGDVPVAAGNSGGGVTIKVEVSANPEFTIGTGNAGDDERILSVMKAHIRGMADDIGDELAERLARIFVNMPVKA